MVMALGRRKGGRGKRCPDKRCCYESVEAWESKQMAKLKERRECTMSGFWGIPLRSLLTVMEMHSLLLRGFFFLPTVSRGVHEGVVGPTWHSWSVWIGELGSKVDKIWLDNKWWILDSIRANGVSGVPSLFAVWQEFANFFSWKEETGCVKGRQLAVTFLCSLRLS